MQNTLVCLQTHLETTQADPLLPKPLKSLRHVFFSIHINDWNTQSWEEAGVLW